MSGTSQFSLLSLPRAIYGAGQATLRKFCFFSPTHILSRSETHDSLKFLSWKDASNEPNYKILRPMVVEILESKDNNADENGSVLKQKFNNLRFLKLHASFMHQNFCFGQVHRLTSKAVPIQPFSSILDRFLLMKMSPKLKMMRLKWFFPYKLIMGREIKWKWFHNSLAQFFHPFLIIGSFWSERVRNRKWCDWFKFHTINQNLDQKSICKGLKMLRMNFCVHSWSTKFINSWLSW